MASKYYILEKDGRTYRTKSRLYRDIAMNFLGYMNSWSMLVRYTSSSSTKLLPFKLSKEEREKYKVALRLVK